MAIFSLFKCNHSNRIDVRIGDGTVKITTILTVRVMLSSLLRKNTVGGEKKIGRGAKIKIGGAMPPMPPPGGDAPVSSASKYFFSKKREHKN